MVKPAQDWDTRPLPEPKPRRPLQHLPWAVAAGLIAGFIIAQGVHGSDRRDYDRLMSGLGASGVEAAVAPTNASAP
jgi:hypothetical protein